MDNDPKNTSKLVRTWLQDSKVNVHEALISILLIFVSRAEKKASVSNKTNKPESVLSGRVKPLEGNPNI